MVFGGIDGSIFATGFYILQLKLRIFACGFNKNKLGKYGATR